MPDFIAVIDPVILTPRRRQILDLVAQGLSNGEIGARLYLSPDTIKTHLRKLFDAFGVRRREKLIIAAYQFGLVRCGRCSHAREVRSA